MTHATNILLSTFPDGFQSFATTETVASSFVSGATTTTSISYKATSSFSYGTVSRINVIESNPIEHQSEAFARKLPSNSQVDLAIQQADLDIFLTDYIPNVLPNTSIFRSTTAVVATSTTTLPPTHAAITMAPSSHPTSTSAPSNGKEVFDFTDNVQDHEPFLGDANEVEDEKGLEDYDFVDSKADYVPFAEDSQEEENGEGPFEDGPAG